MTGLPFVWAFWAGRADAADQEVVALLQDAAETGMAHTDEIAAAYCRDDPTRIPARDYLRDNLMFRLTTRAIDGLETYYREAASLGLIATAGGCEFF